MSLTDEVRAFDEWLEYNELSTQGIAFWYALLNRFNRAHWKKDIIVANSVFESKTGLSISGIKKIRNHLKQIGLIDFTSRSGNRAPMYHFVSVVALTEPHTATQSATQCATQCATHSDTQGDTQSDTQSAPINRQDIDIDVDEELKESKLKKARSKSIAFVKPTLEEVEAYCQERGSNVDPVKFFSYYESNGWKVGRNSMKDWHRAIVTWERNDYGYGVRQPAKRESLVERTERLEKELRDIGFESDNDASGGVPF